MLTLMIFAAIDAPVIGHGWIDLNVPQLTDCIRLSLARLSVSVRSNSLFKVWMMLK